MFKLFEAGLKFNTAGLQEVLIKSMLFRVKMIAYTNRILTLSLKIKKKKKEPLHMKIHLCILIIEWLQNTKN